MSRTALLAAALAAMFALGWWGRALIGLEDDARHDGVMQFEWDGGEVVSGDRMVREFSVENASASTWSVLEQRTSCSCFSVSANGTEVRPGTNLSIRCELATTATTGEQDRTATVRLGGAPSALIEIRHRSIVRPAPWVIPSGRVVGIDQLPDELVFALHMPEICAPESPQGFSVRATGLPVFDAVIHQTKAADSIQQYEIHLRPKAEMVANMRSELTRTGTSLSYAVAWPDPRGGRDHLVPFGIRVRPKPGLDLQPRTLLLRDDGGWASCSFLVRDDGLPGSPPGLRAVPDALLELVTPTPVQVLARSRGSVGRPTTVSIVAERDGVEQTVGEVLIVPSR